MRELKILDEGVKDDVHEPPRTIFDHQAWQARAGASMACCLPLVLSSCGIPNLRQALPGPVLPASFNRANNSGPDLPAGGNGATNTENVSQLATEDFFNDPLLTNLICQALAGNRELKILEEDVQIARNEILRGKGRTFPSSRAGPPRGWTITASTRPWGPWRKTSNTFPAGTFPSRCPIYD